MTGTAHAGESDEFVPVVASDVAERTVGDDLVIWPRGWRTPTVLDPVAATVFRIIDGTASIAELIADVVSAVGVPHVHASMQVKSSIALLRRGGALTVSSQVESNEPAAFDVFPFPPST